ncbi:MAG: 4-hydroxy-3-methylbut-2-en-1-yl diphosphate synthase [Caldithrix sp. RBG_13_44_9]|nr:MAG: 4-hydroxy-3-methylbut-2-en-1-yl diphosphate synthase [Caldithrix sp. RBG_13_44_9]
MDKLIHERSHRQAVQVGKVQIGGGAPISIQSMTKTRTENIDATVEQIRQLTAGGCDIIRCAVPAEKAAIALKEIIPQVSIPVVADIHFNYRLALQAIENGVHKIRINPGNIGERKRLEQVLSACRERSIPIRIGVNSGSLEPLVKKKYSHPTAAALVESALYHIKICEDYQFYDLVISLKSSNVPMMIEAYRQLAVTVDYPLHLGVTEAGPAWSGTIRSAIGIGTLLAEGIGDTIRVSLTGEPQEEVRAAKEILKSLALRKGGVTLISCPTCGRLETPELTKIVQELEQRVQNITADLTVAVMGCAVNGPGEAREADLGVACGKNKALLIRRGEVIGKIPSSQIVERLYQEILAFK